MKKILIIMLLVAPVVLLKAQDTLIMKNGSKAGGKFISGNDGVIKMKTETGIQTYKTEDVSAMKFCTPTKGSGKAQSSPGVSYSNSARSYSGSPCDETPEGKGSISFECNMCSGEGRLEINNENRDEKDGALFLVTLDSQHHAWVNRQILVPGKYNWTYSDSGNNASSGSFILKEGDKKKIVLFEKEN